MDRSVWRIKPTDTQPRSIMDQLGKRQGATVQEVCPGCGKIRAEWPRTGVLVNGTSYCCRGCADGTGCVCQRILSSKLNDETKKDL